MLVLQPCMALHAQTWPLQNAGPGIQRDFILQKEVWIQAASCLPLPEHDL